MTDETKQKIRNYVDAYRSVSPFKEEYLQFLNGNRAELDYKEQQNKFMKVQGSQTDMRLRTEIPENLYMILLKHLDEGEWKWFDGNEGKEWFAKNFKEFGVGN